MDIIAFADTASAAGITAVKRIAEQLPDPLARLSILIVACAAIAATVRKAADEDPAMRELWDTTFAAFERATPLEAAKAMGKL
ncbi:MAG: hypothetical protein ACRYG4_04255 [Janthinobacterium lividum]